MKKLLPLIIRPSRGACQGCDKYGQPSVVGWIKYELREGQVVRIPGLPNPLQSFGVWTDVCVECYKSGRVEVASFDHPDNWDYPGWEAYKAAGYGTEVAAIILEMRAEYDRRWPESY